MSDISKEIMAIVDDGELDDLINSYVFSANFDGGAAEEGRAIQEYVARAILAERKRCADIAKSVWTSAQQQEQFDIVKAVSLIRCRIDTGAHP